MPAENFQAAMDILSHVGGYGIRRWNDGHYTVTVWDGSSHSPFFAAEGETLLEAAMGAGAETGGPLRCLSQ